MIPVSPAVESSALIPSHSRLQESLRKHSWEFQRGRRTSKSLAEYRPHVAYQSGNLTLKQEEKYEDDQAPSAAHSRPCHSHGRGIVRPAALADRYHHNGLGPTIAKIKQTVIRREDGDGDSQIRLRLGFELPVDPTIQQMAAAGSAETVAQAAADFDEDGMPDLITGYRSLGRGVLTLHRGSPDIRDDTLDPRSLLPQRAADGDALGTGDFDADGHVDVVVATRGC